MALMEPPTVDGFEEEFDEFELYDDHQNDHLDHKSLYGTKDRNSKGMGAIEQSSEVDDDSGVVLPFDDEEEQVLPLQRQMLKSHDDDADSTEAMNEGSLGVDIKYGSSAGVDIAMPGSASYSQGGSSQVGSLKEFAPLSTAAQGTVAASLPSKSYMSQFGRIEEKDIFKEPDAGLMGTSMPIRIPKMQRRGIVDGSPGAARKGFGADFIPPHLLDADADLQNDLGLFSPSTSIKREKLMARNAILRSTGFIEVRSVTAPSGEIFDAVKESVLAKEEQESVRAVPTSTISIPRTTSEPAKKMASSLTALLGSLKD